jgi:hypothetical protein
MSHPLTRNIAELSLHARGVPLVPSCICPNRQPLDILAETKQFSVAKSKRLTGDAPIDLLVFIDLSLVSETA